MFFLEAKFDAVLDADSKIGFDVSFVCRFTVEDDEDPAVMLCKTFLNAIAFFSFSALSL